jgi:hypothetical protein
VTERRNPGCAFGPCNDSKQYGGRGCHLCDDIATLPQRGRGVTIDEDAVQGVDDTGMVLTSDAPTKKAKKKAAPKPKRSASSGGLF